MLKRAFGQHAPAIITDQPLGGLPGSHTRSGTHEPFGKHLMVLTKTCRYSGKPVIDSLASGCRMPKYFSGINFVANSKTIAYHCADRQKTRCSLLMIIDGGTGSEICVVHGWTLLQKRFSEISWLTGESVEVWSDIECGSQSQGQTCKQWSTLQHGPADEHHYPKGFRVQAAGVFYSWWWWLFIVL